MKRSMADEIAAAGECDCAASPEMLIWGGGAVELAPLIMLQIMTDGAEMEKKAIQWVNM